MGHQGRMSLHAFVYLVVALFALNIVAPAVQAGGGKSNRVVVQEQDIVMNAPGDFGWTALQNIANASDYQYLDYNLTWIPFLNNNTDITGVLIHNLFAPATWETDLVNRNLSLGSYFRVLPQDIISGVSEAWFRLPVTNVPSDATISMTVYRVSDPIAFNMSFSGFGIPDFDSGHNVELVYDITLDPLQSNVTVYPYERPDNAWVNYKRWQNISVVGANDTLYYNFTYVKACFGLFPNEYYFVEFDITLLNTNKVGLLLSSGDFGSDDKNNSWFWMNGNDYYLPIDLDTSFICTQGMSVGITGIGTREAHKLGTTWPAFYINASIPMGRLINVPTGYVFFNAIIPFLLNLTYDDEARLVPEVFFCNESGSDSYFHEAYPDDIYSESTYNFLMLSENLSSHVGESIDHIRMSIRIENNDTPISGMPPAPAIKFWGTPMPYNETIAGYTDLYWYGQNPGGTIEWRMFEKQWFVPFGYYSLDNNYWVNTNQPIITVPANNPITFSKIDEVIQKFKLRLYANWTPDVPAGLDLIFSKDFWAGVGDGLKWLWECEKEIMVWTAKTAWWVFEHTSLGLLLTPWYWLYRWARDHNTSLLGLGGLLWNKLKAIGQWLWETIELVFDALEWFGYWSVRVIYAFSMAIVYIVNVFGVISINSALLAVARTGNGKDFVKAFRAGWKFVFAIISLLLSLAIMAIAIVGAVVPF